MGIDYHLAKAIKRHAPAAPFRVATLGRLNWHLTRKENRMLFGGDDRELPEYREFSEGFFLKMGSQVESFDLSPLDQPTWIADLNLPMAAQHHDRFDMVIDGGTLEHVYDAPQAMRNVLAMLRLGGVFLAQSPVNGFAGHGCYQLSPEFWRMAFAHERGNSICEIFVQTSGSSRLARLKDHDGGRSEWSSLRQQFLLVVARKENVTYAPPACQSDYAGWIATGVNPTYRPTPTWRRFILERCPFLSRWIEGWVRAVQNLYALRKNAEGG